MIKIKAKSKLIIRRVKSRQMDKLLKLANSQVLGQSKMKLKDNN